jgi:TolB protein
VRILTPGGRNPAWAPGSEIIFDNGGHIHAIMPDGTGQRQVTSGSGSNDFPSWSLDGTRIVFDSERGVRNLFVIDSDGTNERRLTNGAQGDEYWSPTWGR